MSESNKKKRIEEVFGVSNTILLDSYVDRGNLDREMQKHLRRKHHVALRGESKCGKSWFRQRNIPDAIVVQCRFGKTVLDIYSDALSQLGIKLSIEETSGSKIKGRIEAQTSIGLELLAKLGFKSVIESSSEQTKKEINVGHDINDLRYIAQLIIESGRRLIIEDFHYLSNEERESFSFDLKALWDYGCFVIIVGVWSQKNLLTYLNPDLSGRIFELSIYWSPKDLEKVIAKGSNVLKVNFSPILIRLFIENCFGNVGILQQLLLLSLDKAGIEGTADESIVLKDENIFKEAAGEYADQLNALYQVFAKRVAFGIKQRKDSTGIYAHAMAAIVEADDQKLIEGFSLEGIFQITHKRQSRIQKGNLRTILNKLEELQIDKDGRGLVIAYDSDHDEISVVDRQLLFYRKFLTVNWPWEDLIREQEAEQNEEFRKKIIEK